MRLLVVVLLSTMVLLSGCAGDTKQHDLDGSVLIFQRDNMAVSGTSCEGVGDLFDLVAGSPVRITPKGEDPVWSELALGFVTEEGNCRLKFDASIPEADSYVIEVGGRLPVTRQRNSIEHPDRWWVTLDWDAMPGNTNA